MSGAKDEPDVPAGTYVLDDDAPVMSRPHRRAGLVATVVLVAGALFTLKGFLPAMVWATIFAIGLWPLVERLGRRFPRHRGERHCQTNVAGRGRGW